MGKIADNLCSKIRHQAIIDNEKNWGQRRLDKILDKKVAQQAAADKLYKKKFTIDLIDLKNLKGNYGKEERVRLAAIEEHKMDSIWDNFALNKQVDQQNKNFKHPGFTRANGSSLPGNRRNKSTSEDRNHNVKRRKSREKNMSYYLDLFRDNYVISDDKKQCGDKKVKRRCQKQGGLEAKIPDMDDLNVKNFGNINFHKIDDLVDNANDRSKYWKQKNAEYRQELYELLKSNGSSGKNKIDTKLTSYRDIESCDANGEANDENEEDEEDEQDELDEVSGIFEKNSEVGAVANPDVEFRDRGNQELPAADDGNANNSDKVKNMIKIEIDDRQIQIESNKQIQLPRITRFDSNGNFNGKDQDKNTKTSKRKLRAKRSKIESKKRVHEDTNNHSTKPNNWNVSKSIGLPIFEESEKLSHYKTFDDRASQRNSKGVMTPQKSILKQSQKRQ